MRPIVSRMLWETPVELTLNLDLQWLTFSHTFSPTATVLEPDADPVDLDVHQTGELVQGAHAWILVQRERSFQEVKLVGVELDASSTLDRQRATSALALKVELIHFRLVKEMQFIRVDWTEEKLAFIAIDS